MRRDIVLSFSGSGHLLCYQLGVAMHLLEPATSAWAGRITRFAGASGGAITATLCTLLRRDRLGEFVESTALRGDSFRGVSEMLHGEGPFADCIDEAVAAASAKQSLFLSATHCRTGRNALFSRFRSGAELRQCLLASAAIPQSFHPFDLMSSRRPTYPEGGGIIVSAACEHDGGEAAARDMPPGELPFSPHGEAYVDGGISDTAPTLHHLGVHALTVSPISGPQGRLGGGGAAVDSPGHYHLAPVDTSPRVPWVAPRIGGMRCYLSRDNLRALGSSIGASPRTLERWYSRGQRDARRFLETFEPPE